MMWTEFYFYINNDILLRTQTSPVQVRVMEQGKLPIRIIFIIKIRIVLKIFHHFHIIIAYHQFHILVTQFFPVPHQKQSQNIPLTRGRKGLL